MGCDEEPLLHNDPVQTVEGIRFEYSLLNERGEASKTFKYGENFSFRFEMTNEWGADLYCWNDLVYELMDGGFGKVIAEDGTVTDLLWGHIAMTMEASHTEAVGGGDNPWQGTYPAYYHDTPSPLLPGTYHTQLSHTFRFFTVSHIGSSPDALPGFSLPPLTFSVDFTIEDTRCSQDDFPELTTTDHPLLSDTALILYSDPALDGLGWTIAINGQDYHPDTLPAAYQLHSRQVHLLYSTTNDYHYTAWTQIPVIKIHCISIL
jgi:hypothetical protein